MRCFLQNQRGSTSVEAALLIPIVITAILIVSDLYMVLRARADLERSTATLSTVLASQSSLTANGFDQLVNRVLQGGFGSYKVIIGQIYKNAEVKWYLTEGEAGDICENPLETSPFQGELPERDESDESGEVAMLFVQACKVTSGLGLTSLILENDILKSISIDRMRTADLDMDEDLRQRAGLPDDEEEEEN